MQRQERVCEVLITVTVVLVCSVSHSAGGFSEKVRQREKVGVAKHTYSTGMSQTEIGLGKYV